MKSRTLTCVSAIILFAALAIPTRLSAQTVSGSGTTNFIPKWTGSTSLGNSIIFQTGSKVGIVNTSPAATLDVQGPNKASGNALTVLKVIGGLGGNLPSGTFGSAGTGGSVQLASGNGGSASVALGGTGGAIIVGGGTGGSCIPASVRCGLVGGNGGSIMLQPGAGGKAPSQGRPGNVILAPTGGNVGIGTTSPGAKLFVAGNFIATGSKSALVETASYGKRQLYAVESPENWFEDFGRAQLIQGRTTVRLDPIFAETVNPQDGYYVFLTPKGDCKGLYVASQSANSFEVRELRHGTGTIAFDYRVVAKRKGYERARLPELKDGGDTQSGEMLAKQ